MAVTECIVNVDASGRELISHGTAAFPVASYQDDARRMHVPWHWHQELEAAVVLEGSCAVTAGSEKFTFSAGEGFFINSGVLHSCRTPEDGECVFHSLVFHPRLISGSTDSIFHRRYLQPLMESASVQIVPLSPAQPWQRQALDTVEAVWKLCAQAPEGYEFSVRSALSQLILQLYRQLSPGDVVADSHSVRDNQRIKTMLAFVHSHYDRNITAAHIASSAAVSQSECLRCFHKTIGLTPIQYVKQYRLQQAALRLMESGEKIADIATACGFQDMSYFTSSFRAHYGCTPTQYRKRETPV